MKFLAFILLFVSISANAGTDFCQHAEFAKSSIERTTKEISGLEGKMVDYQKQLEKFPAMIAKEHSENNLRIQKYGKNAYLYETSERHFELVKNLYEETPIKIEKLKDALISSERWFKENTEKCDEYTTKEQLRKKKPGVRLGMTKTQVINDTSWGEPHHINKTYYGKHVQEQWVYESNSYLYFHNGVLQAIQN
jgi:hypothetical protein